jgi:hypothetical protein
LAGIWLAALAAGAGMAYGLQRLRPVVTSLRALKESGDIPVLGVVGVAFPAQQRAIFRRHLLGFSAASVALVAALGIVLALNRSGVRLDAQALKSLGLDVPALKALVKA